MFTVVLIRTNTQTGFGGDLGVNLSPQKLLDMVGCSYQEKSTRFQMCCPFHDDRTPSSGFYKSTDLFYCYSCDLTLDVIGFYARIKRIARQKAEEELLVKFGGIPEERKADPLVMLRYRRQAEEALLLRRDLSRKEFALLGEQLDKILYCYKLKVMTDEQVGKAMTKWMRRVEVSSEEGVDID